MTPNKDIIQRHTHLLKLDPITTLDNILKQIQNGHDYTALHFQILKIADTTNITVKRLINEYLLHYKNMQYIISYTNILLKDLNDYRKEIVIEALKFIEKTPYFDEYFVREILRLLERCPFTYLIYILPVFKRILLNNEWLLKYNLRNLIIDMLEINAVDVLKMCNEITIDIFQSKEINFIGKFCSKSDILLLMLIYRRMKDEKMPEAINLNDDLKSLSYIDQNSNNEGSSLTNDYIYKVNSACTNIINNGTLEGVYIASKIFILANHDSYQKIFDRLMIFGKYHTLRSYYILVYLRDIIHTSSKHTKVVYKNEDFAIFKDDTPDIKRVKLDIMFIEPSDFSRTELKYASKDNELLFDALFIYIKNNLTNEYLLRKCFTEDVDKTIDILYRCSSIEEPWRLYINSYLHENECLLTKELLQNHKMIYILGNILTTKDQYLQINDKIDLISGMSILSLMHTNNKINEEDAIELNPIKKIGTDFLRVISGFKPVKEHDDNNLEYNYKFYNSKVILENQTAAINIIKQIDRPNITFHLCHHDKELYIDVLRVEKPITIKTNNRTYYIDKCESIGVIRLRDSFESEKIELVLDEELIYIPFTILDLILPSNKYSIDQFNEKFAGIVEYEIFNSSFFKCNHRRLDRRLIMFVLFGEDFYGMELSGQIILKCTDLNLLKRVSQMVRKLYNERIIKD